MFGKKLRLFSILGFQVSIDATWIFIAILVTWSLAVGFFPYYYEGLPSEVYWIMGATGALGLFLSIIFHELSHSLVSRHYGMPIRGIVLFIFGGVAEMQEEPTSAKGEFLMALAGPVASLLLGGCCYWLYALALGQGIGDPVIGVLSYLALINVLLAVFNIIPAFPLDGGRMLRAVLWGWSKNFKWATRIVSRMGQGFGIMLIILGLYRGFLGGLIGGLWWILIGLFLNSAAGMAYRQLLIHRRLIGEPVRRFMNSHPVTVPPSLSIQELVEEYLYKYPHRLFPVVEGLRLVGCITPRRVKEVPRERWSRCRISEIMKQCPAENLIEADAEADRALELLRRRTHHLLVMEGERLVGILTLEDIMKLLSLKLDLEETG